MPSSEASRHGITTSVASVDTFARSGFRHRQFLVQAGLHPSIIAHGDPKSPDLRHTHDDPQSRSSSTSTDTVADVAPMSVHGIDTLRPSVDALHGNLAVEMYDDVRQSQR